MKTQQLDLIHVQHPFTGAELRDGGIKVAADHADLTNENWCERAYEALKTYLQFHKAPFMCEQVRDFAHIELGLPQPPNSRAFGGIMQRAQREGVIKHAGYGHTSNPKSHRTPASMWLCS